MIRPSSSAVSERMKFGLKWLVANALHVTGMLYLWRRFVLRGRAVVLTYHRVLSDEDCDRTWSHPAIVVRARTFEQHVALLKRRFRPLTLDEFTAHLREKRPFPPGACLVTFDDGWRDTATEAWPILRRHGVPAVVFLSVGLIGSAEVLWQERLRALLFEAWRRSRDDEALRVAARKVLTAHGYAGIVDTPPAEVRTVIIDAVLAHKYDDPDAALAPIGALERLLSSGLLPAGGPDAFMTWAMARTMAAEGAAFGGHGVTHRLLTTLPPEGVDEEIALSRTVLETELGTAPYAFAYPDGKWSPSVAACLETHGFTLAFSTEGGFVASVDSPWTLRRLNMHEASTSSREMFLAQVVGAL
ncbi:MAG: polysaccharide deacetylase family protein [Acidobacteria bacterium]|nr:polysaccharide deacetylase family protein [Acidobacteriota bacterium]